MSAQLPPTEASNPSSKGLDGLDTRALVETIVADQRASVEAVLAQSATIACVVDEITARLKRGGTLHYVGAGSSGRIATLDAAEMPPTFGTPPERVRSHVAGGPAALLGSVEDAQAGDAVMGRSVEARDAVIGISASGSAPYVVAAIERARKAGAYTVAITSVARSALARAAEASLVLDTGPEVLAGSTRLKAGTAQKIALNAISTAVMVRLGKVHDNLMVDVVSTNRKLRARALRLVRELAGVDEERARELLDAAGNRVKIAVVMERRAIDATQAQALLERHGGVLRELI
jgi:N-acetylmuramic acid 6-phosphate etherase